MVLALIYHRGPTGEFLCVGIQLELLLGVGHVIWEGRPRSCASLFRSILKQSLQHRPTYLHPLQATDLSRFHTSSSVAAAHPYPPFLLSSLRCSYGHVSRSAILPITMSSSQAPNPKQDELSSQTGQSKSAADEPTIEEIRSWDENKLLQWIQQKLPAPLEPKDVKRFLNAVIDGSVFLRGAGDRKFFQDAGLSFVASVKLAELAKETVEKITGMKSKYSHLYHGRPMQTVSLQCRRG